MYYFVNSEGTPAKLNGVDRAQVERLKIFTANGVSAKLVSFDFSPALIENARAAGVDADQVINLYDVLCQIDYHQSTVVKLNDLHIDGVAANSADDQTTRFYKDGELNAQVEVDEQERVVTVRHFDDQEHQIKVQDYSCLGYVARERTYSSEDGRTTLRQTNYCNQAGEVCLTFDYQHGRQSQLQAIQLVLANEVRQFDSELQLQAYFLDTLNQHATQTVFVADRVSKTGPVLQAMTTETTKLAVIHTNHQLEDGRINPLYNDLFAHLDLWNGLIASTVKQVAALQQFVSSLPIYHASMSIVRDVNFDNVPKPVDHKPGTRILMVGRISPVKQFEEGIEIFRLVHLKYPETTLDIYGDTSTTVEADHDYYLKLLALVQRLELEVCIHFRGYVADLEPLFDHYDALLCTSKREGTALVLNEAMSRGVPVVSYNFDYGPDEFVENGGNGYLVPVGNRELAAKQLGGLLKHRSWQRMMRRNAFKSARRYSQTAVWRMWQKVIDALGLR